MEDKRKFSKCVSAGTRVYYFDAIVDRHGQPFISVSEIPTEKAPGKKKRQRVFIHASNFDAFAKAFSEVSQFVKNEISR